MSKHRIFLQFYLKNWLNGKLQYGFNVCSFHQFGLKSTFKVQIKIVYNKIFNFYDRNQCAKVLILSKLTFSPIGWCFSFHCGVCFWRKWRFDSHKWVTGKNRFRHFRNTHNRASLGIESGHFQCSSAIQLSHARYIKCTYIKNVIFSILWRFKLKYHYSAQ